MVLAVACSLWSSGIMPAALGMYTATTAWLCVELAQYFPGVLLPRWVRVVNPFALISPGGPVPPRMEDAAIFMAGTICFTIALLEIVAATLRRCVLARENPRWRKAPRMLAAIRAAASRRPAWYPGPTLDGNPVLWREWQRGRSALGLQAFWVGYLICSAVATVIGAREYWSGDADQPLLIAVAGYALGVGVLALAIQAGLSWSEEKSAAREGLDLLLATPLSGAAIIGGKWWGVGRYILLVVIFPFITSLILMIDFPGLPGRAPGILPTLGRWAIVAVVLGQCLLYGAAFVSVGVMLSTRLRTPGHAVAWTVGIYLAVALFLPTFAEVIFVPFHRGLSSGLGAGSPIAGPIVVMMTLFSDSYFANSEVIMPAALGWLLVAAITAWGLNYVTVRRFDRWTGRNPADADQRSRSATGPELGGRE